MPYVQLIRAPNPGPMTLDGTNTWVITDEHEGALVVDPGPAIQTHLEAILAVCSPRLVTIVLTHRHLDHSEGAAMLAERAGCGVRAADPQFRIRPDGISRLITGDMVLGRGTTVITHPDGDLAAYFDSLDLLEGLVRTRNVAELLPGHGPIVADPLPWLSFYRDHRRERLGEIRAALAAGDRTASEIVARVYANVDRSVWPAAEQSVRAQLDYLREHD